MIPLLVACVALAAPPEWREHGGVEYALVVPVDPGASDRLLLAFPPGAQDRGMVEVALKRYLEVEAVARGWVVICPVVDRERPVGADEFAWFEILSTVRRELRMDDEARPMVAGISNGGRTAWSVATRHPARFAGLVALPGFAARDVDRSIAELPVAMFVGGDDAPWVERMTATRDRLIELGSGDVELRVFPGEGHVPASLTGAMVFDALDRFHSMDRARRDVAKVLDDFHRAASEADGERYFGHFAPGAVFLGTDAAERWTVAEFRAYAEPYFAVGRGWTYHARERHVSIGPSGRTAWFDERLWNESYGETRGSGALILVDGAWKVTQYNLTFPIPNDIATDVVAMIRRSRAPLRFERVVIDAARDFEAVGAADFDRDGAVDLVSGDTIFFGPSFQDRVRIATIATSSGYRHDFADVPLDVDGDGWVDVVSCSWHDRAVVWRRNPGDRTGPWEQRVVDEPGPMETAMRVDVDGDGRLDFLPSLARGTAWYRVSSGTLHPRRMSPDADGHGVGFGDVNGDGRGDLLKPGGWFEAPVHPADDWVFHAQWDLGRAGIGILAHDFDGDGWAEVIHGNGHDYGLFLQRRVAGGDGPRWRREPIDESWSQAHALRLVDFDKDGVPEVLTGKRRYAHNGKDPGAEDPQIVAIYRYVGPGFERVVVSEGGADGVGLQPAIDDFDGDGWPDFAVAGRGGLYVYRQLR